MSASFQTCRLPLNFSRKPASIGPPRDGGPANVYKRPFSRALARASLEECVRLPPLGDGGVATLAGVAQGATAGGDGGGWYGPAQLGRVC
jgi:hypothetical protein